jgi:hypothetical protein
MVKTGPPCRQVVATSSCLALSNSFCMLYTVSAAHSPLALCTGAFLYVPYSVFLISNKFCNEGSRAVKLHNCTGGVVWALKSPSDPFRGQVGVGLLRKSRVFCAPWALVHKNTYAPMILRTGPG